MLEKEGITLRTSRNVRAETVLIVDPTPGIPQNLLLTVYNEIEKRVKRSHKGIFEGAFMRYPNPNLGSSGTILIDNWFDMYSITESDDLDGNEIVRTTLDKDRRDGKKVSIRSLRIFINDRSDEIFVDAAVNEESVRNALQNMSAWVHIADKPTDHKGA